MLAAAVASAALGHWQIGRQRFGGRIVACCAQPDRLAALGAEVLREGLAQLKLSTL